MTWSKTRSTVEGFFADSMAGRVRLHLTGYRRGRRDDEPRAWMTLDGEPFVNMTSLYAWYWGRRGAAEREPSSADRHADRDGRYGIDLFCRAVSAYPHLAVDEILSSDDSLVVALGMLDRRVGKGRLAKFAADEHGPLVRFLYLVRCDAEGVRHDLVDNREELRAHLNQKRVLSKTWKAAAADETPAAERALRTRREPRWRALIRSLATADERSSAEDFGDLLPLESTLVAAVQGAADRQRVLESLDSIERRTSLLQSEPWSRGVVALAGYCDHWLRPATTWKRTTHNDQRQFASLARHLVAQYEVPSFLDRAWYSDDSLGRSWFLLVGQGKSIREADELPVPLTKKVAQHCLLAPEGCDALSAIRWGQTLACGGSPALARAIAATRLTTEFRDDPFWQSVIRFFVNAPMFDVAVVGPIVDYLFHQRFAPCRRRNAQGVIEERPPLAPNLSMRGRTLPALLQAVERWHGALSRAKPALQLSWAKSDVADCSYAVAIDGQDESDCWRFVELVTGEELFEEGAAQHHCVATYAESCYRGEAAIWSLRYDQPQASARRLTIEVRLADSLIAQIRGKANRLATPEERRVVERWARDNGLRIADYCR